MVFDAGLAVEDVFFTAVFLADEDFGAPFALEDFAFVDFPLGDFDLVDFALVDFALVDFALVAFPLVDVVAAPFAPRAVVDCCPVRTCND